MAFSIKRVGKSGAEWIFHTRYATREEAERALQRIAKANPSSMQLVSREIVEVK